MRRTTQPARVECVVSKKCRHEYVESCRLLSGEIQYVCDDCGFAWREFQYRDDDEISVMKLVRK
jgi:hypothetical protein